MIYNLAEYIDQNSSLTINVNGFQPLAPDDCIAINESSGDERPWFDRQDSMIQFVSRATNKPTARENAYTAYNLIKKKYGLELPSATVGSTTFPAVTTYAIRPVTMPQYAYDDDNGRSVFTFSVDITTT